MDAMTSMKPCSSRIHVKSRLLKGLFPALIAESARYVNVIVKLSMRIPIEMQGTHIHQLVHNFRANIYETGFYPTSSVPNR